MNPKIITALLIVSLFAGCVSAPAARAPVVSTQPTSPPPQVIVIREYYEPYYYPMVSWHIGFGWGRRGWRR